MLKSYMYRCPDDVATFLRVDPHATRRTLTVVDLSPSLLTRSGRFPICLFLDRAHSRQSCYQVLTMSLKRKRSSVTISPAVSATDGHSNPYDPSTIAYGGIPAYYPLSKSISPYQSESPFLKPWSLRSGDDGTSTHLNSRTRKRHRDGRPDEEEVYASTISKLFEAQRHHPDASPMLSTANHINVDMGAATYEDSAHSCAPQERSGQRQKPVTLHSFWDIPRQVEHSNQAMENRSGDLDMRGTQGTCCDDCDRPLPAPGTAVDSLTNDEETMCMSCGKNVCDLCAVRADERRCLECAMT